MSSGRDLEREWFLAQKAKLSLKAFIKQAWHVLDPATPLIWNWHLDAIADHVQAVLDDWANGRIPRIQNLLINVPPGTAKSRVCCVMAPAWMWLKRPDWSVLCISGNPRVALRDAIYCRDLILSEWYRRTFEPKWGIRQDLDAKSLFANTAGGIRQATSVGARITGAKTDCELIDDPIDAEQVNSKVIRDGVNQWWDLAAANRVNDPQRSTRIGIMQRLHPNEWSGHVLSHGDWDQLRIPMEFNPEKRTTTRLGWTDPRKEKGELLFEARFPKKVIEQERLRLGPDGYAAQHQQDPEAGGGGIFHVEEFRRWRFLDIVNAGITFNDALGHPINFIPRPGVKGLEWGRYFEDLLWSWDFAFKGEDTSDYVVGQLWGRKGLDFFLLHMFRKRMDFTACLARMIFAEGLYSVVMTKLIEDKANGTAIESMLSGQIIGLELIDPGARGKPARAKSVAPLFRSGHVFVPDDGQVTWEDDEASPALFISEMCSFPRGDFDDAVDSCSQALNRLFSSYRRMIDTEVSAFGKVSDEAMLLLNAIS